jgi:hypothetical protein
MDLGRKMTRTEYYLLTEDQKKERKKIQGKKARENNKEQKKKYREANKDKAKEYRTANKDKIAKQMKEYREANKEIISKKDKEYKQTPNGKKNTCISSWKLYGLQESPENIERIYELYLNQEYCNACDIKLTRTGVKSTQACMDHDHNTNRFRHIICRTCNTHDNWQKHFC